MVVISPEINVAVVRDSVEICDIVDDINLDVSDEDPDETGLDPPQRDIILILNVLIYPSSLVLISSKYILSESR